MDPQEHGGETGEALDFFKADITNDGPNPISPSGGNIGSGRSRFWMHTDCIQQIQGRAGQRQIKKKAEIGVSGGPFRMAATSRCGARVQTRPAD